MKSTRRALLAAAAGASFGAVAAANPETTDMLQVPKVPENLPPGELGRAMAYHFPEELSHLAHDVAQARALFRLCPALITAPELPDEWRRAYDAFSPAYPLREDDVLHPMLRPDYWQQQQALWERLLSEPETRVANA